MSGWEQITSAFRCFFSILFEGVIPDDISEKLCGAKPASSGVASSKIVEPSQADEPNSSESYDRALQMLALLQRDGRLVDFLAEDISAYPDAQLGAAVRNIHANCRTVFENYIKLEPIFTSEEDRPVTVQSGFDVSAIKLVGNLRGTPPISGILRHKGWRVKEVTLPHLANGDARKIIAPAEVEVS